MPGLRTLIFDVNDLSGARRFYTDVFGKPPCFDEPFYVGFNIGGYELGLRPAEGTEQPDVGGATGYFDADDVDATMARVVALGAKVNESAMDVGGGVRAGSLIDPFGNVIGFIHNPHFKPECR